MKVTLVVPSCRAESLAVFLSAWEGVERWHEIIIVEDGPSRTFAVPADVVHVAWAEIADAFGDDAWIFSRRDSAIRSAGFALAWRRGADVIVTLDDDCLPEQPSPHLIQGHLAALCGTPRWASTIPGMRLRGLPYRNLGRLPAMLNVGLWSGVPDLDAPVTLGCGLPADFHPPRASRVLPAGQYHPLCGMNLAFRRQFTPLAYFPLMGEGQPFRRFDDIWMGIVSQRVCRHLGWSITCGTPIVRHSRASDPLANLVKEAPGIAANETFWERIDAAPLTSTTAAGCMAEIGDWLAGNADPYIDRLGRAIRAWAGLFAEQRNSGTARQWDSGTP